MNRMLRTAYAAVVGVLLMTACAKQTDIPYAESEGLALKQWMAINRPELLENFQSNGGYYVDVLEEGSKDATPIRETPIWVRFTFTGRSLGGDIVVTRDEVEARQVGTYTKFTRYVPFYKYYAGDSNAELIEGTYLSMHNKLKLGEKYAATHGYPRELEMRYGTKVTLYMPSTVVSTTGISGSGGYEGQSGYELKAGQPFVVTMQITDTVRNPLEREGKQVDSFGAANGYIKPPKSTTTMAPAVRADDGNTIGPILPRWESANKEIPQLYIDRYFNPSNDDFGKFKYASIYKSIYAPYDEFEKLERNILDTLVKRFGKYGGVSTIKPDTIGENGSVKIWYIGRFLDGFIFDSNIPGVRRLIYGETKTTGKPLSYTPSAGGMIQAFAYSIPKLLYGQWACILTTSTNAYGATGSAGQSSTSSSNNSAAANMAYYNYMNSYYGGNGYYNGMYNNYYSNYMYGMYGSFGNSTVTSSGTTSVSTEIPPFTPLLFEIYIEPKAE